MRQEEQSQVEHLKSLEDVALPWQGQTCCSLPKVCFCVLGCIWEDTLRAEEPGTLSLAMAAQPSSEPWAALAACLGWKWQWGWHRFRKKKACSSSLIWDNPVRAVGKYFVTFFLESYMPQNGKLEFTGFIWPCSSQNIQKDGWKMTWSRSVAGQYLWRGQNVCHCPFENIHLWIRQQVVLANWATFKRSWVNTAFMSFTVRTNRSCMKDSFDYCISADNKIDESTGQVCDSLSLVFHFMWALSQPHEVCTKCESQPFHTTLIR